MRTRLAPWLAESVLELIGGTPLVAIRRMGEDRPRAAVWAKMEQSNPGGSVKDRICLAMVEEAERTGALRPGGVVVEPTSGNTGIGLALVCAVRGYRCILTMPESMTLERRQLLEAFGVQVVLTPDDQQMEGAVARAREIAAATPGAFMPQQFDNPTNPRAHAEGTAREILDAMRPLPIDAFVAGVGTGGTISGTGRFLKERNPSIEVVAVEPTGPLHGIEGLKHLPTALRPSTYDAGVVDRTIRIETEEAESLRAQLAEREGLSVGISSGAAVAAALQVGRARSGARIVTILPDGGAHRPAEWP